MLSLHGTGTPLGDPIEVGALGPALGGHSGTSTSQVTLGRLCTPKVHHIMGRRRLESSKVFEEASIRLLLAVACRLDCWS